MSSSNQQIYAPSELPKRKTKLKPSQYVSDNIESMDVPKTPRPREAKIIQALVSGEAKTVSQAMRLAGFHPESSSVRDRISNPDGDLRLELEKALEAADLTIPRILKQLSSKIDARKTVFSKDGKKSVANLVDDNDAQLRATEIALKLHDRTGKIPAQQEGNGASSITVNVLVVKDKVTSNE